MATEFEEPGGEVKKRSLLSKKVKAWLAGALSIMVVILIVQNTQTVTVSVLFWQRPMPLVLLILFVFFVGIAVGYFLRRKR